MLGGGAAGCNRGIGHERYNRRRIKWLRLRSERIVIGDELYRCRVCGMPQDEPPWGEDGRTPSFDICPCCGAEFGYEDCTPAAIRRYRGEWVAAGMKWFEPKQKPQTWNAEEQIAQIPAVFR